MLGRQNRGMHPADAVPMDGKDRAQAAGCDLHQPDAARPQPQMMILSSGSNTKPLLLNSFEHV